MAIYIPGFNPFKSISIRIQNLPYTKENIIHKFKMMRKKLDYNNIIKVEYEYLELPEFDQETMCLEKGIDNLEAFDKLISVLKENKVLNWKLYYLANFEYYDGCSWKLKMTFDNNEELEISGGIVFPKKFSKVYEELKKYIIYTPGYEADIDEDEMLIR